MSWTIAILSASSTHAHALSNPSRAKALSYYPMLDQLRICIDRPVTGREGFLLVSERICHLIKLARRRRPAMPTLGSSLHSRTKTGRKQEEKGSDETNTARMEEDQRLLYRKHLVLERRLSASEAGRMAASYTPGMPTTSRMEMDSRGT